MKQIVVASGNLGKIAEIQPFLIDRGISLISQAELNISAAIEDGKSFHENAIIKAQHVAKYTDLPVLADDSGLIIDALNGEPGIYSARYAGAQANFQDNINKVIAKLNKLKIKNSPARFYCVLALITNKNSTPITFDGIWEGSVTNVCSGTGGFGYDPIFIDQQSGRSAAAMFAEKKLCSHRAIALKKLAYALEQSS